MLNQKTFTSYSLNNELARSVTSYSLNNELARSVTSYSLNEKKIFCKLYELSTF